MNSHTPRQQIKYLGIILAGAVLVSFTAVFVKLANVGPSASAFYRMLFGGFILFIVARARNEQLWKGLESLKFPFLCAVFFTLDLFFWHKSIFLIGPGLSTLLGNMQVFFVAIFSVIFLKERLGLRRTLAIPLAIGGLYLLVNKGWGNHLGQFKLGVLFGVITALVYAGYILVLRETQSEKNEKRYTLISNMAIISLLAALLLGLIVLIEPGESFVIPDLQSWGSLLGLAVMGQVLGWVLISKGLPHVDASAGALALLIQPALTFIWDIIFFNRATVLIEYAGILVVLIAIYMGSVNKKRST